MSAIRLARSADRPVAPPELRPLLWIAVALSLIGFAFEAQAETLDADEAAVRAFYSDLLSAPNAPDLPERVRAVVVDDWSSTPTPRGGQGAEGLIATLRFFGEIIPDLTWTPQEILRDGDRFIVRSIATGAPVKPFFGVEPKAGFEIMTIDIHLVRDGKIIQSYHVEDGPAPFAKSPAARTNRPTSKPRGAPGVPPNGGDAGPAPPRHTKSLHDCSARSAPLDRPSELGRAPCGF